MGNIKIGRITLAFTFIMLGVIIFLDKFTAFNLKDSLLIFLPIVIIALGVEIILGSFIGTRHGRSDLDIFSISAIIILVIGMGVFNLGTKFLQPSYKYSDTVFEETEVEEDNKIIIDDSDIDIEVIKSDDNKVRVKLEGVYNHDDERARNFLSVEKVDGATLVKRVTKKSNMHFMKINSGKMKFLIELPKGVDLSVTSNYGDIEVRDVEGNIMIKSETSDIKIRNTIGDVSVTNSYGGVLGEKILGDISIKSQTGDVRLQLNEMRNVDIEAEYGDVLVRLPKDQVGRFKVVTNYGDIVDKLGFDVLESASTSSINEVRKISTPVLDIRVETGDVTLETN